MTNLFEAATIRMRARGAARALRDLLAMKDLPEGLREQAEGLFQAMGKTWAELVDDTPPEAEDGKETTKESGSGVVVEAGSVGQWLEGSIHQMFTNLADDWYKMGYLTREERIGLSNAIGSALDAFILKVNEVEPGLYVRKAFEDATTAPIDSQIDENVLEVAATQLEEGAVELVERAVRGDGTMAVKLIRPGWGSSGFYPQEVLERDGPKVFVKGTKMFWNHPTEQEERARPEGDLRNLAAELVADARWDGTGTAGPGLYAEAKVFGGYKEALEDLAPHIGVSIRASGKGTRGVAEGREGMVLHAITGARSVDFVTLPGAGGQVVSLFEAVRNTDLTPNPSPGEGDQDAAGKELEYLRVEKARLEEAVRRLEGEAALRRAGELAAVCVQTEDLPEATKSRVVRETVRTAAERGLVTNGVVDEAKLKEVIREYVQGEREYLESVRLGSTRQTGSGISGMGASSSKVEPGNESDRLMEVFRGMGMDEKLAKEAARGRG